MATIYDLADPVELTASVRVLPEQPNFNLTTFLPNVESQQIRFSITDLEHLVRTASFRSYDAPVAIGKRGSLTKRQGALPALGRGFVLGEYARLLQEQLRGMDASEIVGGIDADAKRGVEEIRARMELARGAVLSTGKFTLTDEDGLTLEADFNVPSGQLNTAPSGAAWTSHSTATITTDLLAWSDTVEAASGERPGTFVAGRTVIGHILANADLRNQYGTLFGTPNQLGVSQVNQVLDNLDLPTIAIDPTTGKAVRPAKVIHDGSTVDTYPADKITLLPSNPIGETRWGPTVEALELVEAGRMVLQDTPGVIALALKEANPASITTVVNAVGLPIIQRPKAMLVGDPL